MAKKPVHNSKKFRKFSSRFSWFKKISKKEYNNIQYWQDPNKRQPRYFATRLNTRRTLASFYGGLSYQQLRSIFLNSFKSKEKAGSVIFKSIEKRLDIALYRSLFVSNVQSARHLINHEKIMVNQRLVTNPGLLLSPGDIISINPKNFQWFSERLKVKLQESQFKAPKSSHLEIDSEILTFVYLYSPRQIAIPYLLQKKGKRVIKQPLFNIDTISQAYYPLKG